MMNWKCTDCNWTGTNDELRLKTYPNGGDDTVCPECGGGVEEIELDNAMIKAALIESKRILEFYIKNYNDVDDLNENPEIIKHFIGALLLKCECDDYNGYDCNCGRRAFLHDEALKELELIINPLTPPANGQSKID